MGLTHHTNGVENVEYVANLALLRGMIGRPGAGLLPLRGHSNVQGIGTIGVKPVLTKDVLDAMEAEFELSLPRDEGKDTLASLQAAYNGEIDLAFIMGGNLYAATPDASFASAALDNIKTKIFLTTSLNSGHLHGTSGDMVILPVTPRDEEWSATTQESMFNYVRLSDGGIVRHRNVRPESVVLADLLKGIKPDLPFAAETFKDHRKVRHAIARIVPGMSDLKNIDIAKKEFHIAGRLLHTPRFNTETRRGQFQVSELPTQCVSEEAFPFRLSTIRSEGQFNSIIYEEQDVYRGTKNRWSVLMNHDDIHALGISEGDKVNLRSESGEMLAVEVVEFDIPAGNMMAYYPEANQLTSTTHDPRSKTPAFKNVAVQVTPTGS
jgi:anaerobic selenocysteine-containing dehydrogenase